jgi:flavin-dependent dehydrogenase
MEMYDVLVCGGGIAGSVAAKFSAVSGLKTILIEKWKTPRNKACSGIQFRYLEKLIGESIPHEKLCQNELSTIKMVMPSGREVTAQMHILNFWRSTFDHWLNERASDAGAEVYDGCTLKNFQENGDGITVRLTGEEDFTVKTRYLIAADGYRSTIRKKMRPQDYGKPAGGTLNYYVVGESRIDPHTLYMYYKREFSPLMFSWVYMKDDKYVIGTGADTDLIGYAQKFYDYIKEKYHLRGNIVKKEGFSSPLKGGVYLGDRNILMTGDAAGLVDLYRGMGMDNAALSGRLAVTAVLQAEKKGCPASDVYCKAMKRLVRKLEKNIQRQKKRYLTDEALEKSLSSVNMMKDGLLMLMAAQINRILPPEKIITLPL